jgi:hypothetical protein
VTGTTSVGANSWTRCVVRAVAALRVLCIPAAPSQNNWTDAIDNFEEDAAIDGSVAWKRLTAGIVLQDKNGSRSRWGAWAR